MDDEDKMVEMDKLFCIIGRGPASRCNDIVLFDPLQYNDHY